MSALTVNKTVASLVVALAATILIAIFYVGSLHNRVNANEAEVAALYSLKAEVLELKIKQQRDSSDINQIKTLLEQLLIKVTDMSATILYLKKGISNQ